MAPAAPGRVAVTGAGGRLGAALVRAFAAGGWEVLAADHATYDIADEAGRDAILAWRPTLVVNAAAWTDVDGCARDPERALRVNGEAPGALATGAGAIGAAFVQVSTNEVFDGASPAPYTEDAPTAPINPYGAAKLRGEELVRAALERHLVVRTAWLFTPSSGFPAKIAAAARDRAAAGEPLPVVADEIGNPTPVAALAERIADLAGRAEAVTGTLHLAGEPAVSRLEWARHVVEREGIAVSLRPISQADFVRASRPPPRAVLDTGRAVALGLAPIDWRAAT